jgi:hypothetical protein
MTPMDTKEKIILAVISIILLIIAKKTNIMKLMNTKEKLILVGISTVLLVPVWATVRM